MTTKPRYEPEPGDQERRFAEEFTPGMVDGKLDVVSEEEIRARELAGEEKASNPTLSKEDANYVDGPVEGEPCAECSMYLSGNRCSLVTGNIEPRGHCDNWESLDDEGE